MTYRSSDRGARPLVKMRISFRHSLLSPSQSNMILSRAIRVAVALGPKLVPNGEFLRHLGLFSLTGKPENSEPEKSKLGMSCRVGRSWKTQDIIHVQNVHAKNLLLHLEPSKASWRSSHFSMLRWVPDCEINTKHLLQSSTSNL